MKTNNLILIICVGALSVQIAQSADDRSDLCKKKKKKEINSQGDESEVLRIISKDDFERVTGFKMISPPGEKKEKSQCKVVIIRTRAELDNLRIQTLSPARLAFLSFNSRVKEADPLCKLREHRSAPFMMKLSEEEKRDTSESEDLS